MPVSVVTFSVQQGSDGHRIAQLAGQKLGFPYYDAEIVSQAAAIAGVSPETVAAAERWPTFIERMLERLALTTVVSEGVLPAPPSTNPSTMMMTSSDYRQIIEQVVVNLAERGNCVIVGHAGQVILRKKPDVFKVLVTGSVEKRTERVAREQSLTAKDALAYIKDSDHQRINFFKHVYGVDWLDASHYDLSVNSDETDIEPAVTLVLTAIAKAP